MIESNRKVDVDNDENTVREIIFKNQRALLLETVRASLFFVLKTHDDVLKNVCGFGES